MNISENHLKKMKEKGELHPFPLQEFDFKKMVPQRSIVERRVEKVLRKFGNDIPLFYISPSNADISNMFEYDVGRYSGRTIRGRASLDSPTGAYAIRMHIYVGTYRSKIIAAQTEDKYVEVRAVVPSYVLEASTDEDIARWVLDCINNVRQGESIKDLTLHTKFRRIRNHLFRTWRNIIGTATKTVRIYIVRKIGKDLFNEQPKRKI